MNSPPNNQATTDVGTSPLSSLSNRRGVSLSVTSDTANRKKNRKGFTQSLEIATSKSTDKAQNKHKRSHARIERDSFRAALMTSFEYVGNDLRKKSKQFFIIVTTVFLTVSFLTFLSLIGQLSPLQMLLQTESSSGDFDMVIMGNTDKLEPVYATKNFYIDD